MAQTQKLKQWLLVLIIVCALVLCCLLLATSEYSVHPRTAAALRGKIWRKYATKKGRSEWLFTEKESTNTQDSNNHLQQSQLTHEEIRSRFEERRRRLQHGCDVYRDSGKFRRISASLHYLQPLNTYFCPIAKCSSTTWRRLFKAIRQHLHLNRTGRKTSAEWDAEEAAGASLIVFVREPYSRLLSAYFDKLFGPNAMYWERIGTYIVENFRPNASEKSLSCGHDVTFSEFIKYVIHAQSTGKHRDPHFIPVHDHCRFCEIPYHYIGHLETISEDLPYIEKEIHSPVSYTRDFDSLTLLNNSNTALNRMRSQVEECVTLEEAGRRLWKKWHARGIISKSELFPLSSGQMEVMDVKTFQDESLKALNRSLDDASRRLQKSEALMEAFSTVSMEDRLKLQQLLFLDFELFGFDPFPPEVFPVKFVPKSSGFSYFSPWDN